MRDVQFPSPAASEDAVRLNALITGSWSTHIVVVCARLHLADALVAGPRTVSELAAHAHVHARSLHRLLRAASTLGLFVESAPGEFALTPLGRLLTREAPGSLKAWAVLRGEGWLARAWEHLEHSVRTGETAVPRVLGTSLWSFLEKEPEHARIFDDAMACVTEAFIGSVVSAYDFSSLRTVMDVGGGRGALVRAVLEANPHLRGIVFDRPDVAGRARSALAAHGLTDRCAVVTGDFFESVPAGADALLLKFILHDWEDAEAIRILTRCREALGPRGRVVIIEALIPEPGVPSLAPLLDMEVLVVGGRERTRGEYEGLLNASGLRLDRVIETASPWSLLEASPAA
jgi:hypothetical protein